MALVDFLFSPFGAIGGRQVRPKFFGQSIGIGCGIVGSEVGVKTVGDAVGGSVGTVGATGGGVGREVGFLVGKLMEKSSSSLAVAVASTALSHKSARASCPNSFRAWDDMALSWFSA